MLVDVILEGIILYLRAIGSGVSERWDALDFRKITYQCRRTLGKQILLAYYWKDLLERLTGHEEAVT
jgi:hypothetical protein